MTITPVSPGRVATPTAEGARAGDDAFTLLLGATAPSRGVAPRHEAPPRHHGPVHPTRSHGPERAEEATTASVRPATSGAESAEGTGGPEPATGEATECSPDAEQVQGAAAEAQEPTAAQVIAAAQVVPVLPVMAALSPSITPANGAATGAPVGAEAAPAAAPIDTTAAPLAGATSPMATADPATQTPVTALPAEAPTAIGDTPPTELPVAATTPAPATATETADPATPTGAAAAIDPAVAGVVEPGTAVAGAPQATAVDTPLGAKDSSHHTDEARRDAATEQATDLAAVGPAGAAAEARQGDAGTSGERQQQPQATPAAPTGNATTALGAATAPTIVTATGNLTAAGAGSTSQVTGQVFPEVTRLVARGDGTHRITLKLAPEALGEVRVVLTLRGGEVQVRVSGSEAAQRALSHGSAELHRLLESAGARRTEIAVGQHVTTSSSADLRIADTRPMEFNADHTHDGAGRHQLDQQFGSQQGGRGGETTDHRTAGTRDGSTSARDGVDRGPQPRPQTPGTRTRTGVDVSM